MDTTAIVEVEEDFTSSFFVNTDRNQNQIASFYIGAMGKADRLSFRDLDYGAIQLTIILPNAPAAMVKYARECQELAIPYIYDPSQQIVRLSGQELLEGMRGAWVLILNEYEFGMLRKKTGWAEKELLALTQVTIVTEGEKGSRIYAGEDVLSVPVAPLSRLVEPTGGGDAYRAGLIKGMLAGHPWETTGRIAALAAAYVLEHHGTQNHRYTLGEFAARYRQNFGQALDLE